ncbi:unnamed protein product [Colletotrichum noveboracense]|uniref:Cyclase n=1 Tax=Colletotrichum noveboracense TaxID=2664923 RepID=A0A9W4RS68_9PEZI|nr:hypothetical protein K456DRAFT_1772467 [Colletotrichum gloeosporioides 23]CAI0646356.1 unnamed protein product [Colletotrichum noveboracense]
MEHHFPAFDELPVVPGAPQGCLWGFYDRNGKKDELGSLNLLTPRVVKEAACEIQTGRRVQLDWPLDSFKSPGFGRRELQHTILDASENPDINAFVLDDEIHINTQGSSQWDSLKHFAHQKSQVFYGGLTYEQAKKTHTNGIHTWCQAGGITGRGILVDMVRYYQRRDGKLPGAWSTSPIAVNDIQAALAEQGTECRPGDILIMRTGYIKRYNESSEEERRKGMKFGGPAIGIASTEETVRWLYSKHFAALAGDTVSFEAWPPPVGTPFVIHEFALVWWGTPLGELWDLETLAELCEEHERWSFFLTSAPLHLKGGIGSPPGAIAIF